MDKLPVDHLMVHGYEAYKNGLSLLCDEVCKKVAAIQERYRWIHIPCGWHKPELGARPTIAEVMAKRLVELGVPEWKIVTQYTLNRPDVRPASDTMQEADVFALFLREMGKDPQLVPFDVIGAWYFWARIRFIYSSRFACCRRFIGAGGWRALFSYHVILEPFAFLITVLDRYGKGRFIQKNRRDRMLDPGGTYVEIGPEAWGNELIGK